MGKVPEGTVTAEAAGSSPVVPLTGRVGSALRIPRQKNRNAEKRRDDPGQLLVIVRDVCPPAHYRIRYQRHQEKRAASSRKFLAVVRRVTGHWGSPDFTCTISALIGTYH